MIPACQKFLSITRNLLKSWKNRLKPLKFKRIRIARIFRIFVTMNCHELNLKRLLAYLLLCLFMFFLLYCVCFHANFDQLDNTLARDRTVRPNLINGQRAKGRKLEELILF